MIIIFVIVLSTVVTYCQGKHIELLSNEEFQDILARRAGGDSNEDNNSKQIKYEESHIDISNRDDKSYIPDVDLALADINRRSYTGEKHAYNANFNNATLPLHVDSITNNDNNKTIKEKKRVSQENKTPGYETTRGVFDTEESATRKNTTSLSTTTTKTSITLPINGNYSDDKPTKDIEFRTLEYDYHNSVNNFESSLKATESYKHNGSDDTRTDKSTTVSILNITTNESTDIFNILDSQELTTTSQNTVEVNTETTKIYNTVTENKSTNVNLETIIELTTYIPALTPTIENEQSTKKPKQETDTIVNIVNEIENITKPEQCLHCYRVYEIVSPTKLGNQPFFRNQESTKYQLNSVPVYRYSPNYNEAQKKTVEQDTSQLHKINIFETTKANELITKFNIDLRKFKVFKKKNITPQGNKRTQETKAEVKKDIRMFDDPKIDMIPELMLAKKKKAYTYKTLVDLKHARIEHLFNFSGLKNKIKKRSNDESEISIHMNVLKNLILVDSKILQQYDWLATTVQIQSALMKILGLMNRMKQSESIHPVDLQILKYIVFLHNFSLGVKKENKLNNKWKKRARLLPRNKKKRKSKLLKEKGLIDKIWLLRRFLPDLVEEDEFSHLYEFLKKVKDGLFDLHEAIRQIAGVTQFNRQNWYGNLKQLYLSTGEKHLRELLLHISMSRLIDLVEHSCKQGLNHNFIHFLETNKKDAKRIIEEMLFIDKIVDDSEINMK